MLAMYAGVLLLLALNGPNFGPDRITDVDGVPTFRNPRDWQLSRDPDSGDPSIVVVSRDGRVEYHQCVRIIGAKTIREIWATPLFAGGGGALLNMRQVWPTKVREVGAGFARIGVVSSEQLNFAKAPPASGLNSGESSYGRVAHAG
jgi:hypothetical protein